MARVTRDHVAEFARIRSICCQGLASATLRERVGDRLARHLHAASYCFGATDPLTALPVHSVSVGLEAGAMAHFFDLILTTPSLDFAAWLAAGRRCARLEQVVPDMAGDPYVQHILRPAGLQHEVQLAFSADGWSWGHLCLRRRASEGPFAGHELRFLDALVPHLTGGLRAAAAKARPAETGAGAIGLVVLGPEGRVELANAAAESLFRLPTSGVRHSFLSAAHLVLAQLAQALATDDRRAPPELTVADETGGQVYRVRGERSLGADGRPRGVEIFEPARPRHADDLVLGLARRGLSRRECRVAAGLVRGQTNAEIAAELSLSKHTVEDHLRTIFDRLGVSSRHQLALQLLGLR